MRRLLGKLVSGHSGLGPGDKAPELALPDQDEQPVALAELWAKGPVVVFFYPQDETPICTAEACAFRDAYEVFQDAGAEVVGISGDPPESHQAFAGRHRLPFRLLSDTEAVARKAFQVPRTLGMGAGRATYVIDRQGVIRHAFSSPFEAAGHVEEALAVVKELAAAG